MESGLRSTRHRRPWRRQKVHKGIRIALDPSPAQIQKLNQHAGTARFVYNHLLAYVQEETEKGGKVSTNFYRLRKHWNSIKADVAPWWNECSKEAASYGCESLSRAFTNFFEGQKAGRNVGYPRFKSKNKSRPSFAYTTGCFGAVENDPYGLKLPKIGRIHTFENVHHRLKGAKVTRMTVTEEGGRWYASLTAEADFFKPAKEAGQKAGIDLGVKQLAVLSDGTVYENPKYLSRSERKLKREQKKLSRRKRGSNRYSRQKRKVSRLYAKVRHQREDQIHKMTSAITEKYDEIVIEDLKVSGMVKDHKLAKAVSDAGFYKIRQQLEYKCAQKGRKLTVIGRFEPTSKKCSHCGHVKAKLALNDRTYICEECGMVMDRDLNAAINIVAAGSAPEAENGRGVDVRPVILADLGETSTRQCLELSLATRT